MTAYLKEMLPFSRGIANAWGQALLKLTKRRDYIFATIRKLSFVFCHFHRFHFQNVQYAGEEGKKKKQKKKLFKLFYAVRSFFFRVFPISIFILPQSEPTYRLFFKFGSFIILFQLLNVNFVCFWPLETVNTV